MEEAITDIAEHLLQAKNVVALTGAGISTESGIPDFRSPGGLWTRVDPGEFSIDRFLQNPSRFWKLHWDLKISGDFDMASAKPNPAHYALAKMEQMGILKCIITQNVDNLHQRAGSVEVVEFHGNMLRAVCMKCREVEPIEDVLDCERKPQVAPNQATPHICKREGRGIGKGIAQVLAEAGAIVITRPSEIGIVVKRELGER